MQSTGWSSVTLTVELDRVAEVERLARTGLTNSTTGAWLPTMIRTSAAAERPVRSVTFSVAS